MPPEPLEIVCNSRINIHQVSQYKAESEFAALYSVIQQENCFENPDYVEAVKRGRYTGNILPKINLIRYDRMGDTVSLPRGYAGRLLQLAKHFGAEHRFVDKRLQLPDMEFQSQITPRPYQAAAMGAMFSGTQGILEAPAGSGKTSIGMEIVAHVGQPALWITHTKDLADQAVARAEQYLDIPRDEIGIIGGGVKRLGTRMTVGLVQTLVRMDISEVAGRFGLVMIDEAHHCPADLFSAVVDQLPARWRYGLTATKQRADGLTTLIDRYIGPTLYKIDRAAVEVSGGLVTPELRVMKTETISPAYEQHKERWKKICQEYRQKGAREPRKPALRYSDVLNDVTGNMERNILIRDLLRQECPGHYSLVLSERVDHCYDLLKYLGEFSDPPAAVVHGGLGKRERQEIIQRMRDGEIGVLFAVNVAREGLDIPRLDRLFLVAGGRNEADLEQKIGRIQRSAPGKRDAVVFDVVDEKIGVLRAQYYARRKVYKKLGMLGGKEEREAM